MENLATPWFLSGYALATALEPHTKLQMIAAEDVGAFEARGFTEAERLNRREIDLAGDERTMPETAAILSRALGRAIEFTQLPIAAVRSQSDDYAMMLEWFDRVGYNADIAALEREFAIRPTKLEEWAARQASALPRRTSSAASRPVGGARRRLRHPATARAEGAGAIVDQRADVGARRQVAAMRRGHARGPLQPAAIAPND